MFDKNFVFVNGGFQQISTAGREYGQDAVHERLASPAITITEPGYVYIYLSNENTGVAEVYFDDFNVTQTKSPVVEDQFYYAFGMMAESSSREGLVKQDYKYNGKELLLSNAKKVHTDGYELYKSFVPEELQHRTKYNINHIERKNLSIRTHLKRLSRKTICFSRSREMLEACLKIYFWWRQESLILVNGQSEPERQG